MGRPRKNVTKEIPNEIVVSEEEVYDVMRFASALSTAITPYMINERMKDVTLNPLQASSNELEKALANPKVAEATLQAFSQDFEDQSMPYKRLLRYLSSMLAFDITYVCTNIESDDEYKSKAYKADERIVESYLDKFDYKDQFTQVVRELLRNETYFGLIREDEKIVLQELPSSPTYTKITGRWDYGLMFSLNMYWFTLPGVDPEMYPPFLRQKANDLWGKGGKFPSYRPAISPELRGQSSWIYWQDIPVDVGWCFKLTPEIATRIPMFSPLFNDLIDQSLMRNLQKSINMSTAARIIKGEVPYLKDPKASLSEQIALKPETLGKFLAVFKAAIGDAIKISAAPLTEIDKIQFDAENDVYNSYLRTALATSGINTNLIFSSDVKPNAIETQLSLNSDEQLMTSLYPQFANFLNYNINKETGKYKFAFTFEGTNFYTDRERRFETVTALLDKGIVLPQKLAAAINMRPQDLMRMMRESKATGFTDLLTPIMSAFQMSGKTDSTGRPSKKDSELGEAGSLTRGQGGNEEKKKK